MRFLFVLQCGRLAGTERVTVSLIRELLASGHDCEAVTLEPIAELRPQLEQLGVAWHSLDFRDRFGVPAFMALRRITRRFKPDVFVQVGHRLVTTLVALSTPLPCRIYQCMHHHAGVKRSWVWRGYYSLVARLFDHVTFLTDWCRREAEQLAPALRGRTVTLYAPVAQDTVSSAAQRAAARAQLTLPADAPLVGAAGRFTKVKRFDLVLQAWAEVAARRTDIQFLLVGAGEDEAALRAQADRCGLTPQLHWRGWQQSMTPVYRALDAFVFTSEIDAFGMVPCEALAHGTPVVCAIVQGGLDEILGDDPRWYSRNHASQAIANGLLGWLAAPDRATVDMLRARIAARCDPTLYARRFLALCPPRTQ